MSQQQQQLIRKITRARKKLIFKLKTIR